MLALEGGHGVNEMSSANTNEMQSTGARPGMIWLKLLNTFSPRGRFDLDKEPLL